MLQNLTTELALSPEITATAYKRATKVLWLDIIVTFAILAAVASLL
jgi:hypothetical protein